MNVLHLIDSGGLYGAEVMLLHLAAGQNRTDIRATIGSFATSRTAPKPLEAEALQRGIPCLRIVVEGTGFTAARALVQIVRANGVDVVHTHGYKPNILLGLLHRGRFPAPLVATLHGWTGSGRLLDRMRLYQALNSIALRRFAAIVHVSRASRQIAGGGGEVIWNGIPRHPECGSRNASALPASNEKRLIVCAGRLSPEKGVSVLLEALRLLHTRGEPAHALIAGEGPERAALESQARLSGLAAHVHFIGYRANVVAQAPAQALVVIPSFSEGLPMVLLEAMRGARPVVATAVGGIPEITAQGALARLVPPGNAAALAQAIGESLDHREEAERMACRAHEFFANELTDEAMARRYANVYQAVLQHSQTQKRYLPFPS